MRLFEDLRSNILRLDVWIIQFSRLESPESWNTLRLTHRSEEVEKALRVMELDTNELSSDCLEYGFDFSFGILLLGERFNDVHYVPFDNDFGVSSEISVVHFWNLSTGWIHEQLFHLHLRVFQFSLMVDIIDDGVLLLEFFINASFTFLKFFL